MATDDFITPSVTKTPTAVEEADIDPYAEKASPCDVQRRGFLIGFMGVFAALWAAGAAYPLFRYLLPKYEKEVLLTELVACKFEDLPKGSAKNVKFGSIPAIVIRKEDGELVAYNAKCTHLGCTVQYKPDIHNIYCACHGGTYDVNTGKNIAGPPPGPLSLLKAELIDGNVVIKRA